MAKLADRANFQMAQEAEIESVVHIILDSAKKGLFSVYIVGLTHGQVHRLRSLGYVVRSDSSSGHSVDWKDHGW